MLSQYFHPRSPSKWSKEVCCTSENNSRSLWQQALTSIVKFHGTPIFYSLSCSAKSKSNISFFSYPPDSSMSVPQGDNLQGCPHWLCCNPTDFELFFELEMTLGFTRTTNNIETSQFTLTRGIIRNSGVVLSWTYIKIDVKHKLINGFSSGPARRMLWQRTNVKAPRWRRWLLTSAGDQEGPTLMSPPSTLQSRAWQTGTICICDRSRRVSSETTLQWNLKSIEWDNWSLWSTGRFTWGSKSMWTILNYDWAF